MRFFGLLVASAHVICGFLVCPSAPAQVVRDSTTSTLNGVSTNIAGAVTIGTNGSFTLLVLTNGAQLNNTGQGAIGLNAGANSNAVRLTGASTHWLMSGNLSAGSNGSFNQLVVTNGALLGNGFGALGIGQSSAGNLAVITGSGSLWSNTNDFYLGYVGHGNTLLVTNGGILADNSGLIGVDPASTNNTAIIEGASSIWSNRSALYVGYSGRGNRLLLSAGAMLTNHGQGIIGFNVGADYNLVQLSGSATTWLSPQGLTVGSNGVGNLLVLSNGAHALSAGAVIGGAAGFSNNATVVTGPDAAWITAPVDFEVGYYGPFSQLVVSNGGAIISQDGGLGGFLPSSNNLAWITGSDSVWSNHGAFDLGFSGPANTLVVSNGGTLTASNSLIIGLAATSVSNLLAVRGGSVFVGNATTNAPLEVRRGQLLLGSSPSPSTSNHIESDKLLITNSAALIEFDSGLLITRGALLSNTYPFVVGAAGGGQALWAVNNGPADHLVYGHVIVGSNASLNQLLVTNNAFLTNSGSGILGYNAGASSNVVTLSGPGSQWQMLDSALVGLNGSFNTLVISNGAVLVNGGNGVLGTLIPSSNNLAIVTGPGSLWRSLDDLFIGENGTGNILVITNGATVSGAKHIFVGYSTNALNNRLVVDGGTLRTTNSTGTAPLDIERGTNVLNSGQIEVDQLTLANLQGAFEFNGGTLRVQGTTNNNGRSFLVGDGTRLANLSLVGGGLHSFANGLLVRSNSSLSGNGTISGTVTIQKGATLAPGPSFGQILLNNSPSLQGRTVLEITSTGLMLPNDQVQVLGPLTYGGTLVVTNIGPGSLTAGAQFFLFQANSYSGVFSSISLPPLDPGLIWTNKLTIDGSLQVVGPPPFKFGSVTLSGSNLVMSGGGGTTNGVYWVLTSTNLVTALSNWTVLLTNQFDGSGNFIFTNSIKLGIPQRFYRLFIP